MNDYVAAERAGHQDGECWRYFRDCPKSLFITSERSKYTKEAQSKHDVSKDKSLDLSQEMSSFLSNEIV